MEFQLSNYSHFAELPLEHFQKMQYPIYVLDFNWNYLFVNDFVYKNLNIKNEDFVGLNMWELFPLLAIDPDFQIMKKKIEKSRKAHLITNSPLTGQRVSIIGTSLKDCYFFSSSIMLNKEDLISDLRKHLERN